jgi:integrase
LKRRQKVLKEAILDDELVILLKRYIVGNGLKLNDYVFRKYSYGHIQYVTKAAGEEAGIPHKVSFHNFRHYFITSLIKKGWSYDQVAKLTGHSSVGTLTIYDHSVASDLREKAEKDIKDL